MDKTDSLQVVSGRRAAVRSRKETRRDGKR